MPDRLLTPQNCAIALIDYQPEQYRTVTSSSAEEINLNVIALCKFARAYDVPVIVSTVGVDMGVNTGTAEEILYLLGIMLREDGFIIEPGGASRLKRRIIERALTRCESDAADEVEPLLTLLRRFAAEAARDEARLFCDELVAEGRIEVDPQEWQQEWEPVAA